MATYDFRILLETVEGKKTSYYSSSFVDTSNNLILSASDAYHRITGSISASYQNQTIFSGSNVNTSFTFKDNTLLSASLSGSQESGSIQFTALDTEYDRLLRYKFIGEKVTNTLGLPSDQWIYVDQVRLPADDEANIFQGNANLGNVVLTDTLTFAGGSDVNSDVPFLIDTGSDRYVKFIDERGISSVALRMGYDSDADTYEISGSTGFTTKIGGIDEVNVTNITSSGFIFSKATDGGNSIITIENSNADNGTDKGVGVEFKHYDTAGNSKNAGKIIAGKDSNYAAGGIPNVNYDSNLQFFTAINGTDTERLRITSQGEARFTGNISASGDIIGNRYIVNSTVSNITQSFSSGSTIFGDTLNDTHQFTGSVFITASNSENTKMGLIVDGNISSSQNIILEESEGKLKLNGNVNDDQIYYASTGGIILDSNEGITTIGNLGIGETVHPKPLTVAGDISASGDILNTQIVQMTNSSSVINTFNTGSFQTCKYLLQVTSASKIQSSEMLVMQNSSNAFNAEYAQINSGLNLIDFTTEVNNSNVELIGSSSFVNCSVKFVRTII